MSIKRFKTIYFIYNADGGLSNEIKYWLDKNLLKKETSCELCDISHGKIFVKSEWVRFIKELKKDFDVEVLHRNEIPKMILEKGFKLPCVIGETENELIELIDSVSLSSYREKEGVNELSKKFFNHAL